MRPIKGRAVSGTFASPVGVRAAWTFATVCLLALAAGALLSACSGRSNSASSPSAPAPPAAPDLRILAGSELRELEPEIVNAARSAGVAVTVSYSGTLEMVDRVNAGEPFDAILPPNGAYSSLALTRKPVAKEKLFYSRVALGVKESKAHALGWDRNTPSWSEITEAVQQGKFNYGMTNPTSSNTGMSALFAVAASTAKKTEDLSASEVNRQVLKDFLSGQKLTAGSSGWLADAYVREQIRLDGLINYEAVLLRLNERPELREKLTVIYPRDGVISADYPLILLDERKREAYNRVVAALKASSFQSNALEHAYLRPSDPMARRSPRLPNDVVVELAFPNNLDVIDAVLASYQAELRRPATSIYVLDVSGSMRGARMAGLKSALELLTGVGAQGSAGRYVQFQNRERVVLLPFSSEPRAPVRFSFEDENARQQTAQALRAYIEDLQAGGGTAIFSALDEAYELAREELSRNPNRLVTIVLLTDGENNRGLTLEDFQAHWPELSDRSAEPIRTFPILFGEASSTQLDEIALLTGGREFEGRNTDLRMVFKEIRGYQ